MPGQGLQDRAGQRADAQLQRVAVLDQAGHRSAITRSTASGARAGASRSGRSVSTTAAKADSGSPALPLVRGIR